MRGDDRGRLEQLCRYLLRPAVAQDRLGLTGEGRVVLQLKTAWADGTSHLVFDPLDFLARLAALTPRPRINLVLYHGVLAPNAQWRGAVVAYGTAPPLEAAPAGAVAAGADPPAVGDIARGSTPTPQRWTWALLMRRAFDVDVLACPACGSRLRLIAVIVDPQTIRAILNSLGSPAEHAGRAPPADAAAAVTDFVPGTSV